MRIQVVLIENCSKLGILGDVVEVKRGYAMYHLIPQKKAILANEENIQLANDKRKHLEEQNLIKIKDAQEITKKLSALTICISRKSSPNGTLYSAVTVEEILDYIIKQGVSLTTPSISIKNSIKSIGDHLITINLWGVEPLPVTVTVTNES